jgi:hypothetical protein
VLIGTSQEKLLQLSDFSEQIVLVIREIPPLAAKVGRMPQKPAPLPIF